MTEDDDTTEVEITMPLEDWGRLALLAHTADVTINRMIVMILEQEINKAKELEE